jgi:hypothetical protein
VDEWIVRLLMVVEPTLIVCVTALFGWWLKLRHERRMVGERGELSQLHDELELLRQEHVAQVAELHERLDFAERLLARGRADPVVENATPTPV